MTLTGFAALFADGAPSAPAPAPGSHPYSRINDLPAGHPASRPGIADPAPHGRRMSRIQFSQGGESRKLLH
ncbi:hypothetical protein AB9K35_10690 [Leisingera sp. XS_AS12]|uniref:hypothetical protein n=1 Tax=Leisingera sp. XS_AS12 TaxID=3241294 RepID=UPI003513778E